MRKSTLGTSTAVPYPYIRAWGRLMGSPQQLVEAQVQRAVDTGAPADAVYERWDETGTPTGTWSVLAEQDAWVREQLVRYARDVAVTAPVTGTGLLGQIPALFSALRAKVAAYVGQQQVRPR